MRKVFGLALFFVVVGFSFEVRAATPPSVSSATPAVTTKDAAKKLDTNVSFDDLLIQGKYQFSDEAVTTVEQDKVLDSLLGVRKDFKDRVERSAARH